MEKDGLVEIIPRKGVIVKYLTIKDIVEIYQVRRVLEGLAARLVAANIDLQGIGEI
jgi:DNA-binding GntR family transcriptional regulator